MQEVPCREVIGGDESLWQKSKPTARFGAGAGNPENADASVINAAEIQQALDECCLARAICDTASIVP
jgi:hypothetical protein